MYVLRSEMESLDCSTGTGGNIDRYRSDANCLRIILALAVRTMDLVAGHDVWDHCLPGVDIWISAVTTGTHEAKRKMHRGRFLVPDAGFVGCVLLVNVIRLVSINVRRCY